MSAQAGNPRDAHGYELSVAFSAADKDEAERVTDAVLLAVCGGKSWRHARPWRWLFGWIGSDVCPRFFFGSGPYELDEHGESKYDAGKRYFQKPLPLFPGWTMNSTADTTTTWTGETDATA